MPKRSNDFQKLIFLLKTNLSEGAKVTESAMLKHRVTKHQREVDVVIRGSVGGHEVMICVECRDSRRRADVTWVETMLGKHRHLATNALVLASRAGFTKEAETLAAESGVETVSYEEQETKDFADLFGADGKAMLKTSSVTVKNCRVMLEGLTGEKGIVVRAEADNLVHTVAGEVVCQMRELTDMFLKSSAMGDYLNREAKAEHKWFTCGSDLKTFTGAPPIFMKQLSPPALQRIEQVHVEGPCEVKIAEFGMRFGKVSDVSVAWGTGSLGGKRFHAVATGTKDGKRKLALQLTPEVVSQVIIPGAKPPSED